MPLGSTAAFAAAASTTGGNGSAAPASTVSQRTLSYLAEADLTLLPPHLQELSLALLAGFGPETIRRRIGASRSEMLWLVEELKRELARQVLEVERDLPPDVRRELEALVHANGG
jgi:hypothetical protein